MQAWRPAVPVAQFRVRESSSRANVSFRPGNLIAWLSVGASIGLAVPALGMAARTYPSISGLLSSPSALNAVLALVFPWVGAVIVNRQPANRIGWLLCAEGVVNGVAALSAQYARYTLQTDPGALPGGVWMAWVGSWSWVPSPGLLAFLLLLFPDGHLLSERWRPAAWLAVGWIVVQVTSLAVRPGPLLSSDSVTGGVPANNPIGLQGGQVMDLSVLAALGILLVVAVWLTALASLGLRFRRATGRERDQLKWFLYSASVLATLYVVNIALRGVDTLRPWVAGLVLGAAAFLPVSVGIAVLRHRLYDIDRLISRTLAFGILWLLITIGYVSFAAALGILAGGRLPVEIAVICTIVATLVFQPARRVLERLADRWVFGRRLGGYELLTRFGATLEGTIDPHDVGPRLAAMVRQGLNVEWVRVRIRRDPDGQIVLEPIGVAGIEPDALATPALTAPLVHGEERIGEIDCGPKRDGAFSTQDQELLTAIGLQAALAIRNTALTAELAERLAEIEHQTQELTASRTRLVQAEEAGRRRIERDIHDGVQQQLVALLAKLRLARNQIGRGSEQAATTLAELQEDTRQALDDLRELARGIHPAVLSDRGLLEAIEARVARLPIDVRIETDGLARGTRLPEAVEGAAYFLACEGLANTLKYSGAKHACVRLATTPTRMQVEVADDGRGFDPAGVTRSGLRGLADRIEAVGGSLRIVSRPGEGTRVSAELPLGAQTHG